MITHSNNATPITININFPKIKKSPVKIGIACPTASGPGVNKAPSNRTPTSAKSKGPIKKSGISRRNNIKKNINTI